MLRMKSVTKKFGDFTALNELSLKVPQGAVYGLVGPNGAGKSTAIRLLTGIYRPDSGSITMEGHPIYENPAIKERICSIGDESFHFPSANLEDMRKFYKGIYPRFDDELFNRLYEVFQLPKTGAIRRFSKGMQKQAAFHLAICTRPDVLVLDEPVDGLDPVMRRQVWSLILSDVASHGTTVLISSHNLRELEDICDHVGIMDEGHMRLERDLEALQSGFVKVQVAFPKDDDRLPAQLDVLHHETQGRLHTLVVRGVADSVEELLVREGAVFVNVLPLSLEEIFIYEVGGAHDEER